MNGSVNVGIARLGAGVVDAGSGVKDSGREVATSIAGWLMVGGMGVSVKASGVAWR